MEKEFVETASGPMKRTRDTAQPCLKDVVRTVRREMLSDRCAQTTIFFNRIFAADRVGEHRSDFVAQQP